MQYNTLQYYNPSATPRVIEEEVEMMMVARKVMTGETMKVVLEADLVIGTETLESLLPIPSKRSWCA